MFIAFIHFKTFIHIHDTGMPGNEGPVGSKGHAGDTGKISSLHSTLNWKTDQNLFRIFVK